MITGLGVAGWLGLYDRFVEHPERRFRDLALLLDTGSANAAVGAVRELEYFDDLRFRRRTATELAAFVRRRQRTHSVLTSCVPGTASDTVSYVVQRALAAIGRLVGTYRPDSAINLDSTNLRGVRLSGANVRGASLRYACLRDAVFDSAILDSANLYGATLDSASFREASLRGATLDSVRGRRAIFTRGKLEGTKLVRAELRGASFRSAHLLCATLFAARLDSVDVQGARVAWADFYDANLTGVRNWTRLETSAMVGARLPDRNHLAEDLRRWSAQHRAIVTDGTGRHDPASIHNWQPRQLAQWHADSVCGRSVRGQ